SPRSRPHLFRKSTARGFSSSPAQIEAKYAKSQQCIASHSPLGRKARFGCGAALTANLRAMVPPAVKSNASESARPERSLNDVVALFRDRGLKISQPREDVAMFFHLATAAAV